MSTGLAKELLSIVKALKADPSLVNWVASGPVNIWKILNL